VPLRPVHNPRMRHQTDQSVALLQGNEVFTAHLKTRSGSIAGFTCLPSILQIQLIR